jgi:hypothetical protein
MVQSISTLISLRKTKMLRHAVVQLVEVEGSIPDEATEFFNLPNPSSRTRPWG